jgi:hypothetical protein
MRDSMNKESYFGAITRDWAGFLSEYKFNIPYFEKGVEIFLGEEYDEDGEEIKQELSKDKIVNYENTFKIFLEKINEIIEEIKTKAFDMYKNIYAKYYEKEFIVELFCNTLGKRGEKHSPLEINNNEKHFEYIKNIYYIRILDGNRIKILIHYALDTEHGLEISLENNKIKAIGGIAET